ncbi:hypothetical protein [Sporolactobacillus putidus]|uniref:Uncharacterized protein n=1 Tax=Sporolactobacillus putidus TaxID=492735 RepID=A0A917VXR6_9BACL|nr:hypothetical protein [Sporolactobacillus putidus]GGL42565.1 hypothetical protein GCM10007968_03130 [Sporolactobacillus putidus]
MFSAFLFLSYFLLLFIFFTGASLRLDMFTQITTYALILWTCVVPFWVIVIEERKQEKKKYQSSGKKKQES